MNRKRLKRARKEDTRVAQVKLEAKKRLFEVNQRAKGLVLYENEWVIPAYKTSMETKYLVEQQAALLAKQDAKVSRLSADLNQANQKLAQMNPNDHRVAELERIVSRQQSKLNQAEKERQLKFERAEKARGWELRRLRSDMDDLEERESNRWHL